MQKVFFLCGIYEKLEITMLHLLYSTYAVNSWILKFYKHFILISVTHAALHVPSCCFNIDAYVINFVFIWLWSIYFHLYSKICYSYVTNMKWNKDIMTNQLYFLGSEMFSYAPFRIILFVKVALHRKHET